MYKKIHRLLAMIFFAVFFGISVFALLGHSTGGGTTVAYAYAAPAEIVYYPPTVTVVASTVMTTGSLPVQPISITVTPNCGDPETGCQPPNGSLQVSVVSVFSQNVSAGNTDALTTFVTVPFSEPRVFNYSWIVPHLDNHQVILTAEATNSQTATGESLPLTVTIDTIAPQTDIPQPNRRPWITDAEALYTWAAATDGAGIASYQINITNTETYSAVFSTPNTAFTFTQFSTEGVGYYARLRAIDTFGNVGDWSDVSPVVMLDTSAPTLVFTAPVTHIGLSPFSVEWQAEDRHSDIKQVNLTYRGPGIISASQPNQPASGSFTLPQNDMKYGTYTFTVQAENNAGIITSINKNTEVIPAIVYLPLVLKNYPPQWTRASGTAGIDFRGTSFCGNSGNQVWYAGTTEDGVWKSNDNGVSWFKLVDASSYPYPVIANPTECNEAFVSLWGKGVNKITGTSVTPVNTNLSDLYLYGLAITGTTFYAGTNSAGVFKTNVSAINWQPVNSGINDRRIRSLSVLGSNIYAGARNCKLYVSNNQGSSWAEKTVLGSGCNDAQVWSVAQVGTRLFAGLGGDLGLYVSQDSGTSWSRVNSVPAKTIYGVAYDKVNDKLYVSAYGSGVYRCSVGGSTQCAPYNNGLGTKNTRELALDNGQVMVSTDDGVWYIEALK